MFKGTIAIIGRPNVGKSTLFNRLTRSNQAIVDDRPGVTRDRIYGMVSLPDQDDFNFMVIDTGGFECETVYYQPFTKNLVWEQTELAIKEADLSILVFDAKAGIHTHDEQLFRYLKKNKRNVICIANKVDGKEHVPDIYEFYRLGVESIIPVSAAHNRGISDLFEEIETQLLSTRPQKQTKLLNDGPKIALIGGPNAGKSSILNRLCGFNRSLVSEVAGTTRDVLDTPITYNKRAYTLLDTAGIRRRPKIIDKIESLSVMFSLRTIEQADVVIAVVDAIKGITDQDARLISLSLSEYKPVLIVINKWDLIPNKTNDLIKQYEQDIRIKFGDATFIPVLFASCLENQRISKIMEWVEKLYESYHTRITTAKVNEEIDDIIKKHTPQVLKTLRRRIKFYFSSQVSVAPPTFVIMTNYAHEIQTSYKRYIMNQLRARLGFDLIPIKIIFRNKGEKTKSHARSSRKEKFPENKKESGCEFNDDDFGTQDDNSAQMEL